jgi:hypothetical protein
MWLPGLEPVQGVEDMHDGAGDQWFTPAPIIEAARRAMGSLELDPCCHPAAPAYAVAKTAICMSAGGDGLTDPWPGSGGVWCNPPYSDVKPWINRCREAAKSRPVIMMIPTRPETRAWDAGILSGGGWIVQQVGRVRFVGLDGAVHGNGMITTCFVMWDGLIAHRLRNALGDQQIRAHVLRVDEGLPW